MSVLVKNMAMPCDCIHCDFKQIHFNGTKGCLFHSGAYEWKSGQRPDFCPLVEIPTPLADRDLDETCEDCKEYDHERHCCPRFTRVIKTTVDELKKNAQTERKWIPCSERLPEDNDYKPFSYYEDGAVLICAKSGSIGFGWYYESTKSWANEDDRGVDVIAWMPLPEPYEEGEQE